MRMLISFGMLLAAASVSVVAMVQQPPAGARPAPSTQPPPPPPAVKVGETAPDFTLPYLEPAKEPNGRPTPKQVKLSDFKGTKNVVLAFFPAAFSPG